MATTDYGTEKRGGGLNAVMVTFIILLFAGTALSGAAYVFNDQGLTITESMAAGFGGLAGIIIGLIGAMIGIVVGLLGALIGIVAAGGAVAFTLFLVGSPIIAIILFVLLMRSRKTDCPDPDMHRAAEAVEQQTSNEVLSQ